MGYGPRRRGTALQIPDCAARRPRARRRARRSLVARSPPQPARPAASNRGSREHQALLELYALDSRLQASQARVAYLATEAARLRRERTALRTELRTARATLGPRNGSWLSNSGRSTSRARSIHSPSCSVPRRSRRACGSSTTSRRSAAESDTGRRRDARRRSPAPPRAANARFPRASDWRARSRPHARPSRASRARREQVGVRRIPARRYSAGRTAFERAVRGADLPESSRTALLPSRRRRAAARWS